MGTPRSGTTLVQRLASELPGVRVPPETHFFRLFAAPLLGRRRFPLDARQLRQELRAFCALDTSRGMELDADAIVEALGGRCRTAIELFGAIVRALAGHARIYGEKTPSHLLWWRPLTSALPSLRVVAVVRDPRAVAASYLTAWGRRQHALIAERWLLDQREVAMARARLGAGRCLVLRYEDVVAGPAHVQATLAAFVQAPVDLGPAAQTESPPLHLPWETWKERASEVITAERAAAWKGVLSDVEAAEVEAVCREGMRRLGYVEAAAPAAARATEPLRPGSEHERRRYRLHRNGTVLRNRIAAASPAFG